MSRRQRARRRFLRRWAPVVGRERAVAIWNGETVERTLGALDGVLYSTPLGYADPLNRGRLEVDLGDGNGWHDISGAVRDLQPTAARPHPYATIRKGGRRQPREGSALRAMLRGLTGRN